MSACAAEVVIACQGPLPSTVADFWLMVWQQRCPAVVMLTRETEGSKVKCGRYFPLLPGHTLAAGQLAVTNTGMEDITPDGATIERHLLLTWKGGGSVEEGTEAGCRGGARNMAVRHLHFVDWPDHGVPRKTAGVRDLIRAMRVWQGEGAGQQGEAAAAMGPVVVHCR